MTVADHTLQGLVTASLLFAVSFTFLITSLEGYSTPILDRLLVSTTFTTIRHKLSEDEHFYGSYAQHSSHSVRGDHKGNKVAGQRRVRVVDR